MSIARISISALLYHPQHRLDHLAVLSVRDRLVDLVEVIVNGSALARATAAVIFIAISSSSNLLCDRAASLMSENIFEPGNRLVEAPLAQIDSAGHHNEVVDNAGVARERDRYAGLDQALSISFTLVTQGVILGGNRPRSSGSRRR
jgi:hypothetical protein